MLTKNEQIGRSRIKNLYGIETTVPIEDEVEKGGVGSGRYKKGDKVKVKPFGDNSDEYEAIYHEPMQTKNMHTVKMVDSKPWQDHDTRGDAFLQIHEKDIKKSSYDFEKNEQINKGGQGSDKSIYNKANSQHDYLKGYKETFIKQ